jgi:hypothetical protein
MQAQHQVSSHGNKLSHTLSCKYFWKLCEFAWWLFKAPCSSYATYIVARSAKFKHGNYGISCFPIYLL